MADGPVRPLIVQGDHTNLVEVDCRGGQWTAARSRRHGVLARLRQTRINNTPCEQTAARLLSIGGKNATRLAFTVFEIRGEFSIRSSLRRKLAKIGVFVR